MVTSSCDDCRHKPICKYTQMHKELEENVKGGNIEIFRLKLVCYFKESKTSYKMP